MDSLGNLFQKYRPVYVRLIPRHPYIIYLLLSLLLICNAIILKAQPKFINEASGLAGYNFCDIASFLLLFSLAELFLAFGGFSGGMCFSLLFFSALIDVFYLALPLKIVFDDVLLAFTDQTSLSLYGYALPLLILSAAVSGIFLRKILPARRKACFFWLILLFILGFISLFCGAHSALDKKDFFPFHIKTSDEMRMQKTDDAEFNLFGGKWAHKLREAWGGFPGDFGFILASIFRSGPLINYPFIRQFPVELEGSDKISPAAHTILLIMGESSNPSHYSIYGYPLSTTPYLEKLEAHHFACHLTHAHSAANNTRYAVLPSVSFWRPNDLSEMTKSQPIMSLAAQAGFQTYWLSRQIENNFYAGFIGYNIETASNLVTPNESHGIYTYQAAHSLAKWDHSDSDLLPLLNIALSQKYFSHFIGLHLLGNHSPYSFRYEKKDLQALPSASAYDLSIHATDRLLYQIYQQTMQYDPNTLILYVSDHGEDPENGGHATAYGHLQYEIPVIFFGKNAHYWCDEAEKLRQKNGWFSSLSDNLLISKMLGFQIKAQTIKERQIADRILLPNKKAGIWEEIPENPRH